MGDFFLGWRRKAGVVALVLACVFVAGWVKSYAEVFWFGIKFYPTSWTWFFISGPGQFIVIIGTLRRHRITHSSRELTVVDREIHDVVPDWVEEHRWPELFFQSEEVSTLRVFRDLAETAAGINEQAIIPYWFIVIPLTLLSAYLLLVKPTKFSDPRKSPTT